MVTVNHITELNRVTQGHKIHALFHGNYRKHGNTNETSITIYSELPFVFGCVTVVPDVASYSKLYRYRGHVYRNHRNPGVMSLVTMETGIHGKWHVTQVTHKNYAEIATNVRLYTNTRIHTHIHRYPWQLECDSGHSQELCRNSY